MRVGVIGYGSRIREVIHVIRSIEPDFHIVGIVDPRANAQSGSADEIQVFSNSEQLIRELQPDGLMIGTRCSLHSRYALEVIPSRIPLFLEKPVSTTYEDWQQLNVANRTYNPPVVVSHPMRLTSIVKLVKEIVASGQIGTVEHVQAINNVSYGGVYYHSWYRDESETGGLFLQKATHDFDYINFIVGLKPVSICAMASKQVFKGNKPAGLTCKACDENRTCAESTIGTAQENEWIHCCFAEDTGNEDSGSALIRYENGMHVSYSQNFFARRGVMARGARLLGYKGTVDFDFTTGLVTIHNHHTPRIDRYQFDDSDHHWGGDEQLAANFIDLIRGRAKSASTLQDGLISALMCLKAKESSASNSFQHLTEIG